MAKVYPSVAQNKVLSVDTLTAPPVIGHLYRVRCIKRGEDWLPVLGYAHRDPEVGPAAAGLHLHHDFRFWSNTLLHKRFTVSDFQIADWDAGRPNGHPLTARVIWLESKPGSNDMESPEYAMKLRRCYRPAWDFPAVLHNSFTGDTKVSIIAEHLEPLYAEKTLDLANPVCPHRGIRLHDQPVDEAGCVTCPGHGLKWDITTGRMVSRLENATATAESGLSGLKPLSPKRLSTLPCNGFALIGDKTKLSSCISSATISSKTASDETASDEIAFLNRQ